FGQGKLRHRSISCFSIDDWGSNIIKLVHFPPFQLEWKALEYQIMPRRATDTVSLTGIGVTRA
ncbi:MAG: hypothetical protein ACOYMG_09445, partial [Candidatus Methylumidiphilus sp.]